jgi:hypothetical protein
LLYACEAPYCKGNFIPPESQVSPHVTPAGAWKCFPTSQFLLQLICQGLMEQDDAQ